MIPEFPQFKSLSLEDNEAVEQHTRNFPYYSDYNFSSLWSWDIAHGRQLSTLNNNLVVKFTDYETGEPFFSFLGMHDTHNTCSTLLDFSESLGLKAQLQLMPEISVHDLSPEQFNICPDRNNFDYIYLTKQMAPFEGNQYKSKRKAAERFMQANPFYGFEITDLSNPLAQEHIREIQCAWKVHKGIAEDDQSIRHETEAIERIFSLSAIRNLFAGIVTVDGKPQAFTIEEVVNNILSIGHFWKTANYSQGEYEFLASKTALYLEEREITYWNWEQDLGIDSLRASKTSYRPSDFLRKFIVTKKSPTFEMVVLLENEA